MLQDYHLYHDSVNNKVLLSSNRQKQALFDKYIIAQIPGKYYELDTALPRVRRTSGTLYSTSIALCVTLLVYILYTSRVTHNAINNIFIPSLE